MQVFAAGLKPELAYGLGMGGQTDSQVRSQVVKSRKFQTYTDDLRSTCIDLCTNMSSTKVNASQSKRSIVDAAVSTAKKKKRKKMKLYAGRSPSLVPDAG